MGSAKEDAGSSWQHRPEHLPDRQEVVRLKVSSAKWLSVLLLCLVFLCGGVWMIQDGDAVGWFEAIFGGFGLVVSATALVPGHDYLELRADGFEVRSLLRAGFVNWAEVAEFRIFSVFGIGCMSFVSMVFMESYIRKSFIRRLHRAVFSLDDGLPDTYGMKAEQLADLLRMWRDYHLSRRVRQSGKEGAC